MQLSIFVIWFVVLLLLLLLGCRHECTIQFLLPFWRNVGTEAQRFTDYIQGDVRVRPQLHPAAAGPQLILWASWHLVLSLCWFCQSHGNPSVIRQFPESCWEIYKFPAAFPSTTHLHANKPYFSNTRASKMSYACMHTNILHLLYCVYVCVCVFLTYSCESKLNTKADWSCSNETGHWALAVLFPLLCCFSPHFLPWVRHNHNCRAHCPVARQWTVFIFPLFSTFPRLLLFHQQCDPLLHFLHIIKVYASICLSFHVLAYTENIFF